jgi:hypothetical protein
MPRRVTFFDLTISKESRDHSGDKFNTDEVNLTLSLLSCLIKIVSEPEVYGPLAGKIGIITPTKAQVTCLKAALTQWLPYWTECSIDDIFIGTPDDFVG